MLKKASFMQLPYSANMKKKIGMVSVMLLSCSNLLQPALKQMRFLQAHRINTLALPTWKRKFSFKEKPEQGFLTLTVCEVCLLQIAGGSGLTPMLQVIKEIVRNPIDQTQVNFIYANQSVDDIILKKELDEIAAKNDNVNVKPSL